MMLVERLHVGDSPRVRREVEDNALRWRRKNIPYIFFSMIPLILPYTLIELSGHDTKGTGYYPLSIARLCTRGFLEQDSYELLGRPLLFPTLKENLSFIALWYGTKKKRNETKKLKGKTTTETPLSHPPTPLHTSRFHC
jgi:hypothetical protein